MEIQDGLWGAGNLHAAAHYTAGSALRPVDYTPTWTYGLEEPMFYRMCSGPDEDAALSARQRLTADLSVAGNQPSTPVSPRLAEPIDAPVNTTDALDEADETTGTEPTSLEELAALADLLSQPLYPEEIQAKINLAFTAGTLFHDRAAQTRILLGAFDDTETMIDEALRSAGDHPLNSQILETIANLRRVEAMILSDLRASTGLDLSDKEWRALLEHDHTDSMLPHNGNLPQAVLDVAYGVHARPVECRSALESATTKAGQQLRRLTFRIQQALNDIKPDPTQRRNTLKQINPWIDQGKALLELLKAANPGGKPMFDAINQFDAVCNYYSSLR